MLVKGISFVRYMMIGIDTIVQWAVLVLYASMNWRHVLLRLLFIVLNYMF